ncbi:MAG: LuxR C-terminal-related transcriptional regulator [Candidatus Micrarchaeaceae archaeon]
MATKQQSITDGSAVHADGQRRVLAITRAEMRVMKALRDDEGSALPTREIADKLCVCESTAKFHIGSLLAKFGVKNKYDLAVLMNTATFMMHDGQGTSGYKPQEGKRPTPAEQVDLTPREKELLGMLREKDGFLLTDKELANRMGICLRTAKYNISNLLLKFDVESRYMLANSADFAAFCAYDGSEASSKKAAGGKGPSHIEQHITLREKDLLGMMRGSDGFVLPRKKIAERMGISERTANFHIGNLMAKFGAGNMHRLADIARRMPGGCAAKMQLPDIVIVGKSRPSTTVRWRKPLGLPNKPLELPKPLSLTDMQISILDNMVREDGTIMKNWEIAMKVGKSIRAVKYHIESLYDKLGTNGENSRAMLLLRRYVAKNNTSFSDALLDQKERKVLMALRDDSGKVMTNSEAARSAGIALKDHLKMTVDSIYAKLGFVMKDVGTTRSRSRMARTIKDHAR